MKTRTRITLLTQFIDHCKKNGASLEQIRDSLLVAGIPSPQLEPVFEEYLFESKKIPKSNSDLSLDLSEVKNAENELERKLGSLKLKIPKKKVSEKIVLERRINKSRPPYPYRERRQQMMVRGKTATSSGSMGYSVLVAFGILIALLFSKGMISPNTQRSPAGLPSSKISITTYVPESVKSVKTAQKISFKQWATVKNLYSRNDRTQLKRIKSHKSFK